MKDSGFGRLIGVLVAPGETFRSIAERATWVPPMLVLVALGFGLQWAMQQRTNPEQAIREQTEAFGVELTQEQLDEQVARAKDPTMQAINSVVAIVAAVAFYFLTAFLFWMAFRMFGSEMSYISSLATLLYGLVPFGIAFLLNIPLVLARETISSQDVMAGGVLVSNLGFLAGEETAMAVRGLLQSVDFFSIWVIVLLVIGYRATARVSTATSAGVVLTLWLIGVAVKVGLMALPSLMTGGGS